MLNFLEGKVSDRKMRLFAVACCREIWDIIVSQETVYHKDEAAFWRRCQDAVTLAERFVDGLATEQELAAATAYPRPASSDAEAAMCAAELPLDPAEVAECAVQATGEDATLGVYARYFPHGYSPTVANMHLLETAKEEMARRRGEAVATAKRSQADLIRDLVRNPFRPYPLSDSWRTPDVIALAEAVYDTRDFTLLPSLADEMERAGCQVADVLGHCRNGGTHVRGCWLVDFVLGKD